MKQIIKAVRCKSYEEMKMSAETREEWRTTANRAAANLYSEWSRKEKIIDIRLSMKIDLQL